MDEMNKENSSAEREKNGAASSRTSAEQAAQMLAAALSKKEEERKNAKKHGRRAHVNAPAQSAQESENLPEEPPAGETAEASSASGAADKPASERAQFKEEDKADGENGQGEKPSQSAPAAAAQKPSFTPSQRARRILLEFFDLLKGAAFPFIVMCVFSTTIILFYGFEDLAVQIISVVFGEGLMIAAFIMFGRQNGAAAYRKFKMNEGKRKLGSKDEKILFRTGEYAPWKGFVIGFISASFFLVLQIIKCFGDFQFVNFMLEYACGWAISPFEVINDNLGNVIAQPFYLFMLAFPVCIQGGFYIQGMHAERRRQENINRVEDDKRKGKKKYYYEENDYRSGTVVDMSDERDGKRR